MHGYSRSFTLWFRTNEVTDNGFVMDFGKLKPVKAWLEDTFDHTLLLDTGDPLIPQFRAIEEQGGCKLVVFDDVGMEGTARFVFDWLDAWVRERTADRVWVVSVEVRENEKNSARIERQV